MEDDRFIFAVVQLKIDINGRDFSTLVPVAYLDGTPIADPVMHFPNRGRVWWMVKGDSRIVHAPPGCLVISGTASTALPIPQPSGPRAI